MLSQKQSSGVEGLQSVSCKDGLNYLTCFLWFGLVTGIAEALVILAVGLVNGHFLFVSDHFLWMTPVAEAIFHLTAGVPFLLLAWAFPRRKFLFIVVGVFAFFGMITILSASGRLIWWAVYVLSAGVALRAAWTVRQHPNGFLRLVRRSAPALAMLVAVCAAGTYGRRALMEHRALSQLPEAAAGSPNVLLVVLDTVRADALSHYCESGVDTPNMKQFGDEGIVFERAMSTCSWTLPSHASMFTGRYPHELSANWDSALDEQYPTLAEMLSSRGYSTAGFVANLSYCSRATGLARGFAHYEDFGFSIRELARHCHWVNFLMQGRNGLARAGLYDALGRKHGEQITQDFSAWLDSRHDRPFFAFLNYLDAHDPYLPERLLAEKRELTHEEKLAMKYWRDEDPTKISSKHRQFARACYDSKIRELDEQMGQLLENLEQRGLRENTIVIITSDHGEHFGEHGVYYHGNTLYESAVHVPLMICWLGHLPAETRVAEPVTLRDLAATILDLALVSFPADLPGSSLRLTWQDPSATLDSGPSRPFCTVTPHPALDKIPMQKHSPAAKGIMYSLLDGQDYVIREADDTVQLFDFREMSDADTNLADDDTCGKRVQRAVQELDRFLGICPGPEKNPQAPARECVSDLPARSSGKRQLVTGNIPATAGEF